jgi:hypothetical protein
MVTGDFAHETVEAAQCLTPAIQETQRGTSMTNNAKQTSKKVAHLAGKTLHDPKASATAKSLAASALAQSHSAKQTSGNMEHKASEVLHSNKYSQETKTLAASVLAQSSKDRTSK